MFSKNISDHIKTVIFILFIGSSIYTNIKMNIIVKYPPQNNLSLKEKVNAFLLILGKIDFILMIFRFGYFSSEINDVFMLFLFMLFELLVLDYAYVYNNSLIILKRRPISLDKIHKFEVKQFSGQYYIYSYINKEEKLNFNLSQYEYEYLIKIKNI